MTAVRRVDSSHFDFRSLVRMLDEALAELDGKDHAFYAQFNKIDNIRNAVVAYEEGAPVGCGAIKPHPEGGMEVKRMFVVPAMRGKGIASAMLAELEAWAKELGHRRCVLETGKRQPDAIALYQKHGYRQIPNFGQYKGIENSVCFEKSM